VAHRHDLALAVVEFADALVSDLDIVDPLHVLTSRCVELLGVHAAVLMLPDERGQLRVMAGSSGQAHLLALFELKTGEGPSLGCYRAGRPVSDTNLDRPDPRWPRFSDRARRDGFASMHALPLRQHEDIIGVLGLLSTAAGPISDGDARIMQALARLATVTVLRQRTIQHLQVIVEQLQSALSSRVLVEQAKGVVAERFKIDMSMAFETLRNHARRTNLRLSDLAQCVVDGAVEADQLAPPLAVPASRAQTPAVMR